MTDLNSKNTVLQIEDIKNLLVIIEMSAQRGTFKAAELSQVGALYDRVHAFINSVPTENAIQSDPQIKLPGTQKS